MRRRPGDCLPRTIARVRLELGEVSGYKHSLEYHLSEALRFFGVFTLVVIGGTIVACVAPNRVPLNVGAEGMNALMLPLVPGFLILLVMKVLPPEHWLRGVYA